LFQVYHDGFAAQLKKWPQNPLDRYITWCKKRPGTCAAVVIVVVVVVVVVV